MANVRLNGQSSSSRGGALFPGSGKAQQAVGLTIAQRSALTMPMEAESKPGNGHGLARELKLHLQSELCGARNIIIGEVRNRPKITRPQIRVDPGKTSRIGYIE
jgi:hypothetical protein